MQSVGERLLVSLLCAVLAAAVYYTGSAGMLLALMAAAAVHELSHLAAMLPLGCRPAAFRPEPGGFCIEYTGREDSLTECLIAASGPLGGVLAGLAAQAAAGLWARDALRQFAALSFLLSAFNLLPILPLDGGRIFRSLCVRALGQERGVEFSVCVSRLLCLLLLAAGIVCLVNNRGSAPLFAAIWLLCLQKESGPLAKEREMG